MAETLKLPSSTRFSRGAKGAIAPGNAQRKRDLAWFEGQIARLRSQAQR
jgi:hypothetical protein